MLNHEICVNNLMWEIKYLMELKPGGPGFGSTAYSVGKTYPDTENLPKFPAICVYKYEGSRRPSQIGGRDYKIIYVSIDVFANSDIQREDIAEYIEDHFYMREFPMYDMSIKYPDSVGNYTGIPSLGSFFVDSVHSYQIEETNPKYVADPHHQLIIFTVVLPST